MRKNLSLSIDKLCIILLIIFLSQPVLGSDVSKEDIPKLDNPVSVQYLKKNLRKSLPRLVINSSIERDLRSKLKTDPVVKNMSRVIIQNA